jgi:DNA-binding NarL/FixJ family response regulator
VSYVVLQRNESCSHNFQICRDLALEMDKRRHYRILLIDDSELIGVPVLKVLSTVTALELLGQATSVKGGLLICEEKSPDIVILDINLPDGSGIALLKELKIRHPHIRVIMFTNSTDSFYRRKCIELGAEHFLDKAKDFDRIPQLVTDYLNIE